ncbi:hypothetical protein L1987_67653 [Smallanthus sonchifolius]|uniref:Uncharacterized protein n=1 Tax=Smallanthus sonchifolius TaxID=185202 RepID=A0ACB9B2C5_9ASTR|nr:hypothetical protein L1987_67653 [Smallanthus sonchifolius]
MDVRTELYNTDIGTTKNYLSFINVTLSFTVIVLIGAGWPYVKSYLQGKEKKVLMIVIPLQVFGYVASVVIQETGPYIRDWVTWNQVFLLVDLICCCAVIFPVVWSIRSFSKTDAKSARHLSWFCVVVIGYLLVTRIGVFALKVFADYKDQWVCSAAEEMASLVFYLVMFYMFRPVEEDEYVGLDDEGEYEEAPEMAKGYMKN